MSRQLGPTARGEVGFVLQLAYLIVPLIVLGVDRQLLRSEGELHGQVARRHLLPCAVFLSLVLLLVFRDWRALAGVVAYGVAWLVVVRSTSIRENTFKSYLWIIIAYSSSIIWTVMLLYLINPENWALWLTPYLLPGLAFVVIDLVRHGVRGYSRPFAGVTRLSLRLLPAGIALMVVTRADRGFMPGFSTSAQLGIYIAVATGTETIVWISTSLADHRVAHLRPIDGSINTLLRLLGRDCGLFATYAHGWPRHILCFDSDARSRVLTPAEPSSFP